MSSLTAQERPSSYPPLLRVFRALLYFCFSLVLFIPTWRRWRRSRSWPAVRLGLSLASLALIAVSAGAGVPVLAGAGLGVFIDKKCVFNHTGDEFWAFNLTWHDWLNLKNLILVSQSIAVAALAREDSRGAHYRADHPTASDLMASTYTQVRLEKDELRVAAQAVDFTHVRPGESLLQAAE